MSPVEYKLDDVFGIRRDLPLNYTERESADAFLVENLTRDKHLVIYGSSKQGKTSLRKHCLNQDDYIVVHCSNKTSLSDLHSLILKQAGYEITLTNTRSASGSNKILAKFGVTFGYKAEAGAEKADNHTQSEITSPLELDPGDVNDVILALEKINFEKYIVLEDFHYLSLEAQKEFSFALKAFHENSKLCFLIIGVWLEENRLTVYNGDLTGRVVSINADKWEKEELQRVITSGEELLNIEFDKNFQESLIGNCFDSVYILQESCYRCCRADNVQGTEKRKKLVGKNVNCESIVKEVVNEQTGRFNSFITQFADGFQETALHMHKWILYPILTLEIERLEKGIRQKEIRDLLKSHHPKREELNPGNLTQALLSCASLQVKKDIKPIILDYDQTNLRLTIVDRSFIIWLHNKDRKELLELADLPTS